MLEFKLITTARLVDKDSLNTSTGKIATGWDDPNDITDEYADFDGKRINELDKEEELNFSPHFDAQFVMFELKAAADITIDQPDRTRVIVGKLVGTDYFPKDDGEVLTPTPNELIGLDADEFKFVKVGDVVTISGGTNANLGDLTVTSLIDNKTIGLSGPIVNSGTTADIEYIINRTETSLQYEMKSVEKLFICYQPFTKINIKSLSNSNVIRLLQLG